MFKNIMNPNSGEAEMQQTERNEEPDDHEMATQHDGKGEQENDDDNHDDDDDDDDDRGDFNNNNNNITSHRISRNISRNVSTRQTTTRMRTRTWTKLFIVATDATSDEEDGGCIKKRKVHDACDTR